MTTTHTNNKQTKTDISIPILTLLFLITLSLLLLSQSASANLTNQTGNDYFTLSLESDNITVDTTTNLLVTIAGKDTFLDERIPLDIVLVTDTSGSMMQSGWNVVTAPAATETIELDAPRRSWSDTVSFSVPPNTSKVMAELDWEGIPEHPGSENSEFILDMRPKDGEWYFPFAGEADLYVDEHFSGKSTKPQHLLLDVEPTNTTQEWELRVNGRYFRPKDDDSFDSLPVTVDLIYESVNETDPKQQITTTDITYAYDAAHDAVKQFVNELHPEDRASFVSFASDIKHSTDLSDDQDFLINEIDDELRRSAIGGGTDIAAGLKKGNDTLADRREDALPVIILLTDGINDAGPDIVRRVADNVKGNDITITTIGLTNFVDDTLMTDVAKPSSYYKVEKNNLLDTVYSEIATYLQSVIANNVSFHLTNHTNLSVSDEITIDDTQTSIDWDTTQTITLGTMGSDQTKTLQIPLTPHAPGNYSFGEGSFVTYTNIYGTEEILHAPNLTLEAFYTTCDERNPKRNDTLCDWDKDFDNDSVINGEDRCSETPYNETANAEGCSCSQLNLTLNETVCPESSCQGPDWYSYPKSGTDFCENGTIVPFSCEATIILNATQCINQTDTPSNETGNETDTTSNQTQQLTEKVSPILECIYHNPDNTYTAYFGYLNQNNETVNITNKTVNKITPSLNVLENKSERTNTNTNTTTYSQTYNESLSQQNTNTTESDTTHDNVTSYSSVQTQETSFASGRNRNTFCFTFNTTHNPETRYVWTLKGPDNTTRTATASTDPAQQCSELPMICSDQISMFDSDNDTVIDYKDQCNDTPDDEIANEEGCSCSQLELTERTCQDDRCVGDDFYDYPSSGYDTCTNGTIMEYSCEPRIEYNVPQCMGGGSSGGSSSGSSGHTGGGSSSGPAPGDDPLVHALDLSSAEPPFYNHSTVSGKLLVQNTGDYNERIINHTIVIGNTTVHAQSYRETLRRNQSLDINYSVIMNKSQGTIIHHIYSERTHESLIESYTCVDCVQESQPRDTSDTDDKKSGGSNDPVYIASEDQKPKEEKVPEETDDTKNTHHSFDTAVSHTTRTKDIGNIPVVLTGTGITVVLFGANHLFNVFKKRHLFNKSFK